ncbi:MAG: response regulator [Candidatus Cyclobacteriaceae bacterium M3_2C_046]
MKSCDYILIEDNPYDVELINDALGSLQKRFTHQVFNSGEKALDYLEQLILKKSLKMPRFIILDLKLPTVSGLEVLKLLKSNIAYKRIPVVAFTNSNEIKDIDQSYAYGVNAYVSKPIDSEEFAKAVKGIGKFWLCFNQPI